MTNLRYYPYGKYINHEDLKKEFTETERISFCFHSVYNGIYYVKFAKHQYIPTKRITYIIDVFKDKVNKDIYDYKIITKNFDVAWSYLINLCKA